MCIRINVSIPTLNKFFMLYSLRSGCIMTMIWYAFRSILCIVLATMSIPELFMGGKDSFKAYLLTTQVTAPAAVTEVHYFIYGALIFFVLAEGVIFVHAMYLANGLFCRQLFQVKNFLVSRIYTWVMEIGSLIILCLIHKIILGWYLVLLMVFILEVYSFAVVYSYYYTELVEESQRQKYCCYPQWP